jgi:hypothetical protein
MSGIEEAALAAWVANAAADSALVYGGLEAGAGTAAAALGTGAGAGAAAAGAGGMTAAQLAALNQQALMGVSSAESTIATPSATQGAGLLGNSLPYGAGDTVTGSMTNSMLGDLGGGNLGASNMLSDPSSVLASDATGNQFVTQGDKYWNYAQQAGRALTKGAKAIAPAAPLAKSLLDPGAPPKQEQIMARQPGGGAPQQQSSVSLLGQQQPHQISPYAPIFAGAGGDDAEMQRRRKLMMQQMGYA